jgi:phosphate transport system substrate-binding protein
LALQLLKPPSSRSSFIENKGSDTIVNLALAWAERYQQIHPEINISVTGGVRAQALPPDQRHVDIANASAKSKQRAGRSQSNGADPMVIIARDAIAIIVNGNLVDQLTAANL